MEYKNLLVEINNGIAVLKINRPKALNALNSETLNEIKDAGSALQKNKDVWVVVVTGEGDKAFIAGADIVEMKDLTAVEGMLFSQRGHDAFATLENMSKPVIAAVNGFALGGGFEVALACDIIYASDKAKVGFPEATLGIFPGFGGTQRAAKLVGLAKAKELIFTGKMINAAEAYEMGLLNKVVPHEELMKEVMALAEKIKSNGPIGIGLAKECINKSLSLEMDSALMLEAKDFGLCFGTKDQKEGMTAFVEKRKATFKGE
ncbi:MAG: putative enoyl-CoA hydratase echA8 [Syntrophorhabdus sp. PtaU1.Bin002]|nr:MAG: putative enoyl-CoA hydratase echA8 [Syntrophorhabdus sp. PtaB.Bin006]OPY72910.1 MAG: putative enoyl-CoA hydratase echA8 [Syntrophorhabdus sp. PtaU1.Bin002]